MKQYKIITHGLLALLTLFVVLALGCNKSLIEDPDVCFTANTINEDEEYVEMEEFSVGEEIHFVSCGTALFEVIYTGDKEISKELQKKDGSDSIIWKFNAFFPDKSAAEVENYFNKNGKPFAVKGIPLAQAGEVREATYSYSEKGEYEVYLEAMNRNEEGVTTKATIMKKIRVVEDE